MPCTDGDPFSEEVLGEPGETTLKPIDSKIFDLRDLNQKLHTYAAEYILTLCCSSLFSRKIFYH